MTVVSGNIRFMGIFVGDEASNDSGIIENSIFSVFGRYYAFGTLRNETNVII